MQDVSCSIPIRVMSDIISLNIASQQLWSCNTMGQIEISNQSYPILIEFDYAHPRDVIYCARCQEDVGEVFPNSHVDSQIRGINGLWE